MIRARLLKHALRPLSDQCNSLFGQAVAKVVALDWLKDYQAITAAVIALIGAWWGASAINAQIRHADKLEDSRRDRRREAVRAVLPLALAEILRYSKESFLTTLRLFDELPFQGTTHTLPLSMPALPGGSIDTIRQLVELSTPEETDFVAKLLTKIQVQASRLDSAVRTARGEEDDGFLGRHNVETYALDAVEIYARANALFDFGRRRTDAIPNNIRYVDLLAAMRNMRVFDNDQPTLYSRVQELMNRYGEYVKE